MTAMRILVASNDIQNAYIVSLVEAYKRAGCEVVVGVENFFLSNFQTDILHLQWLEPLYRGDYSLFGEPEKVIPQLIQQYKDHGAIVVYTVHNLRPHESLDATLEESINSCICAMADIIVHHGERSVELLGATLPAVKQKSIVCPLGDYLIQYEDIPKSKAREHLRVPYDKLVVLNFGSIRKYKGFSLLRQVYRMWKHRAKYLLVAGNYGVSYGNGILSRFIGRSHKKWLSWSGNPFKCDQRYELQRIRTADIKYYFSAADVLILTHTSGLNSGVLAMAATFKMPVVYPDIGNFSEHMKGWIGESYTANNAAAAVAALDRLLARIENGCSLDNSTWLKNNTWDIHVGRLLSAVRSKTYQRRLDYLLEETK